MVTKANPYVYADDNPVNEVDPSGAVSLDCLGSISWNLIIGGLGAAFTINSVIPFLVGLITGATALDAASATIGAALLAGSGAVLGTIGLVLLTGVALAGTYYAITRLIIPDCSQ